MNRTTSHLILVAAMLFAAVAAFALTEETSWGKVKEVVKKESQPAAKKSLKTTPRPRELEDGVIYRLTQLYNWDYLYEFQATNGTIQLYTDCGQPYGCDLYGFWANPFVLTQTAPNVYLSTFTTGTVLNKYQFLVQVDGSVLVYFSHDQCYPSGCSGVPLELLGLFEP